MCVTIITVNLVHRESSISVCISVDFSVGTHRIEIFPRRQQCEIVSAEARIPGANQNTEHQHHSTRFLCHQQKHFICGNLIAEKTNLRH